MKTQNNRAFTLVELIVVITILAVLATVAFISFQGYTSSSRDSVRLADLKSISQALNLQVVKTIKLPEWKDMAHVSASGTTVFYQWTLSKNQLADIWVFNWWFDPLTWSWVIYARNQQKNKFQLGMFFEQKKISKKINTNEIFANNLDKYFQTKWDKIWILLDENTNTVILDDIDLLTTTQKIQSYISNSRIIEWTWSVLVNILPDANCTRLYENGTTKSGIYQIYSLSEASSKREVYCDFSYPEYIITDELVQTWDLTEGNDVNANTASNPASTIVVMNSPIESGYVIHQKWWEWTQYAMNINNTGTCQIWKDITMRARVSYNNIDNIFRQEFRYPDGSRWFLFNNVRPHPELLETKTVDGRIWRLEQVKWLIDRDFTTFFWYLGYNSWTPDKDHYITWIRLWCE